jgi:hypothetical protein
MFKHIKSANLRLDIHNDELTFDRLLVFNHRHSEVALELLEELLHVVAADFESLEVRRKLLPSVLKARHILLESVQDIVSWKIIEIELLQDDEDEQFDHSILLDEHEHNKEDGSPGSSASLAWNT